MNLTWSQDGPKDFGLYLWWGSGYEVPILLEVFLWKPDAVQHLKGVELQVVGGTKVIISASKLGGRWLGPIEKPEGWG